MNDKDSITHFALLVGINDYPGQPLKSAACDARGARILLKDKLKDCIKIYSLIADLNDRSLPAVVQDPESRPTHKNFVSILKEIRETANPGSFVYIHFSGHGTRTISEKESRDVGLVLLDADDSSKVSYLWSQELAELVKLMVSKSLSVTVVLDCCFSGAVYRRGPEDRYLPYDAEMDRWEEQMQRNSSGIQSHSSYRDISSLPNWIRDPEGYAIITACGPHQEATSAKFDGQLNGILSYFLLDTLKYLGLARSRKTVYDRFCVKIRNYRCNQDPILYGNKNQAFFGSLELNSVGINIPIIKREDGSIELQAGHAHGMSVGDEFALFPAKGEAISDQSSLITRAIRCNGLTSILEIPNSSTNPARTGWLARIVSQTRIQSIPIRLASSIHDESLWLSAMKARSLKAHSDVSSNSVAFELALDDNRQYRFLDKNGSKLANLPTMMLNQITPEEVCDILGHLARFQLASELNNQTSAVDHLDNIEISIGYNTKYYGPKDNISMKNGTIAEVIVTNRGDKPVYFYIYDLGPNWQVEQMFRGSYNLLNPNRTERKKFRMTMPKSIKDQGFETCVDVLKVIVTSQPTSFDVLELPRLRELIRRKSDRTGQDAVNGSGNWTSMNFSIHTFNVEKSSFTPQTRIDDEK